MTVNTQKTPPPDLFSHGMVLYILRVYLHSSEIAGKHVFFFNLGIGASWQKQYVPPVKAR